MTWPTRLAAIVGLLLLVLNVYPGVWVDLALFAFLVVLFAWPFWIPCLIFGALAFRATRAATPDPGPDGPTPKPVDDELDGGPAIKPGRRGGLAVAAAVLGVCVVLCLFDVPRRAAFLASRPAFESRLAGAPVDAHDWWNPGRRLGAYHVRSVSADSRGGVYFLTYKGMDGFGPDSMFYGFVHRPNSEGTPYGVTRYVLSRVVGDWYAFEVSND